MLKCKVSQGGVQSIKLTSVAPVFRLCDQRDLKAFVLEVKEWSVFAKGKAGPLIPGTAAALVDAGSLHPEPPAQTPMCCPVLIRENVPHAEFPLDIHDLPAGLQAVMQCLLWPFWCDAQRRHLTHGIYCQLWDLNVRKPRTMVRLDKMLQWVSIIRRWQAVRPSPAPDVILTDEHIPMSYRRSAPVHTFQMHACVSRSL